MVILHIPMLSRPKNPPEKIFLPKGSLRFTHLNVKRTHGEKGNGNFDQIHGHFHSVCSQ